MKSSLSLLVAILLPFTASAAPPTKTKVLLVTGGHAFETAQFFKVFQDNPDIVFTAAAHEKASATVYERDDLPTYDVVALYDMPMTITDVQKARLLSLFERGTGIVVLHHALVSYQDWPDYERIIGGRYPKPPAGSPQVTDAVGYEHNVDIPVVIVAKEHPITAGLKDFTIKDEIYWGFRVGSDVTPLITTTHQKAGKPLAWTRMEGKSRIVYLQLGHDHQAYENANYRELVARSIRWAAGRN
jgi:type 1 glutamine amidotransferase